MTFSPLKDNTLYEDGAGSLSNGAGAFLFAGKTGTNVLRRGLIAFDLSSIPTNAVITGATLKMFLSQTQGGPQAITVSPVSQNWGQGASNAGGSAPPHGEGAEGGRGGGASASGAGGRGKPGFSLISPLATAGSRVHPGAGHRRS